MDKILEDNNIVLDDFNPRAISKKIAERMKHRRLVLNLTQEKLSGMSGVSLGSLKRFENQNIDEIIMSKKTKIRKRARNG